MRMNKILSIIAVKCFTFICSTESVVFIETLMSLDLLMCVQVIP